MKKIVLRSLAVLIVTLVLVLVGVIFYLGNVLKTAVETVGPRFTGGTVTLADAQVRPLRGKAMLKGLVIGNPEGFKTPSAVELGEFRVSLAPRSVLTSDILIHEILIDGPVITLEMDGMKNNNLSTIQRNVQKASPPPATEAEPPPGKEPSGAAKRVIIEELVIRNGKVRISSGIMFGTAVNVPLPEIRLTNIGKEKDTTAAEAFTLVFSEVINTVLAAVLKAPEFAGKGLKLLGDGTLRAGQGAAALAQGTAGAVGDVAGGTARAVGDVTGSAVGAVGNAASGAVELVGGGASAAGSGLKKLGSGLGGIFKQDQAAATNAGAPEVANP